MPIPLDQTTNDGSHMQAPSEEPPHPAPLDHNGHDEFSDFGADPEELELIEQLLQEAIAKQSSFQDAPFAGQDAPLLVTDIEDHEPPRGIHLPKVPGCRSTRQRVESGQIENQQSQSALVEIVCDESAEVRPQQMDKEQKPPTSDAQSPTAAEAEIAPQVDTRPPIERFRRPPKKPFSVTDLISPAWCELQYFYVLSKHGRKKRTLAMKQGSAVHKVLEEQVHVTVPVTITKKEDSWGLRVWNIIQGLRTLRDTGRTREFEVWGTVGGELVNGVIDELSYDCPDPKLEEQSLKFMGKQDKEPPMPEYQASIREYLVSSEHREHGQTLQDALAGSDSNIRRAESSLPADKPKNEQRIYITDVKTRGVASLPTGASIRPTIVQLHLYHHMLENFAQGNFKLDQLATRFKFDVNETFSDAFIAQIANLNQEAFDAVNSQRDEEADYDDTTMDDLGPSTQDSMDIILQHNNMSSLWQYMLDQFQETFVIRSSASSTYATHQAASQLQTSHDPPASTPQSISSVNLPPPVPLPTRLSPLLTAQYVSSHLTPDSDSSMPRKLGSKSIIFNPSFLKSYLYDSLAFWRGEREPKGVVLSEAWKCRSCEFRDDCAWLKEQSDRVLQEAIDRRRVREDGVGDGVVGEEIKRSRV